jgi:hypothetical protein
MKRNLGTEEHSFRHDEPSLVDCVEASLSDGVAAANVHLSDDEWDTLCKTFSKEFTRRNSTRPAHGEQDIDL